MKVTIVGAGHVGLVTGVCLASLGHQVACVDIAVEQIETINRGEVPFYEPGLTKLLQKVLKNGCFYATTELEQAIASGSQVSIIAVGTPPRGEQIDLSYIATASTQIGNALCGLDNYHVVIVKSTVTPGTTETLVRRNVEAASGLKVGEFGLCMNPEFLREGSAVSDFMEPDRIIIGQWDDRSGQVTADLYENFTCPKLHISLCNAELIKYTSNSLLALLISFSNEISSICEKLQGSDIDVVMNGLYLDRRLSPMLNNERIMPGILSYLKAGSGFGGSCLPKDVNALRTFARILQMDTPLLDAVMHVNIQRPKQVVEMIERILGNLQGKTIAVLGLTFKPDSDDLRDSPALKIIHYLLDRGAVIRGYDQLILSNEKAIIDGRIKIFKEPEVALTETDAVLIGNANTHFLEWDWDSLCRLMRQKIIVDTRGVLRQINWPEGVMYQSIGISLVADSNEGKL